jgi:hypothetical protein
MMMMLVVFIHCGLEARSSVEPRFRLGVLLLPPCCLPPLPLPPPPPANPLKLNHKSCFVSYTYNQHTHTHTHTLTPKPTKRARKTTQNSRHTTPLLLFLSPSLSRARPLTSSTKRLGARRSQQSSDNRSRSRHSGRNKQTNKTRRETISHSLRARARRAARDGGARRRQCRRQAPRARSPALLLLPPRHQDRAPRRPRPRRRRRHPRRPGRVRVRRPDGGAADRRGDLRARVRRARPRDGRARRAEEDAHGDGARGVPHHGAAGDQDPVVDPASQRGQPAGDRAVAR